jgi:hypothetical protein
MGLVRGEDVILSALISQEGTDVPVPFGCARSVTFDISTDFIETSGINSGNFKTFVPSGKQYSGNIEGLVFLDKAAFNETRATTTLDLTDIADSGAFPTTGNLFAKITVNDAFVGFIDLYITSGGTFATFADFLTNMNNGINASIGGYTSVISGNSLIITARPGQGALINTRSSQCRYEIDGPPTININSTFSGGVTGYNPPKISLGWMYEKIINGEKIFLKYYETDDDNHYLQKLCEVYIESINETASFDNMTTFSATFKGNGGPTITYGED